MKRIAFAIVTAFVFSLSVGQATAEDRSEKVLQNELSGKVVLLRESPDSGKLEIDLAPQSVGLNHPSDWRKAVLRISRVTVKKNEIKIVGYTLGQVEGATDAGHPVEIRIKGQFSENEQKILADIRNSIFVSDTNELDLLVPPRWRDVFTEKLEAAAAGVFNGFQPDGSIIYAVKPGTVTPPKPIYSPDPKPPSRRTKATPVLNVIIATDGSVQDIRVAKSAGDELDGKAIEAVKTWRFTPAMMQGKPIPVRVNIEISFDF